MNNLKLSELVNLSITLNGGGWENFKSKYVAGQLGMAGRKKDRTKSHEDKGNFEVHEFSKGMYQADDWKTVPYDRSKFDQFYSYSVSVDGKEGNIELSWAAQQKLLKTLDKTFIGKDDFPITVKLKRPDKAYEFELPVKTSDPEITTEDLPF